MLLKKLTLLLLICFGFQLQAINLPKWSIGLSLASIMGGYIWWKYAHAHNDPHPDHYYASKEPNAPLLTEPVEWPIIAVYGNHIFGFLMRKGAALLGHRVTKREEKRKKEKNQPYTDATIKHYKTLYKDLINMDEYSIPAQGFTCFNDWFTRQLKNPDADRPMENKPDAIVSPADCKLLIIPDISQDTDFIIKELHFDITTFLNNTDLAQKFEHGVMMIFRLAPYNYHRYHFPFDCTVGAETMIDGLYHSVNRRAYLRGSKPLTVNRRSYELLTPVQHPEHPIAMVQVGATAVASIVNNFMNYTADGTLIDLKNPEMVYNKGAEMGYFQFGGSTCVLLFPKDTIVPDAQIRQNSLNGYETNVKVRETIAMWR